MSTPHILIVEDEQKIRETLASSLQNDGYKISSLGTGEEALFFLSKNSVDLIIMDLMLPGKSGLEITKFLRDNNEEVPVLMLTAKDSVEDRVSGFESGADDYLVKPFAYAELIMRIKALLKRSKVETTMKLEIEDLEMNLITREVKRAGKMIELTVREFEVLEYLVRHRNEVVSRDMLARDVWKETSRSTPIDNVVDVHMARLRKKVDQYSDISLISTVRGVGFIIKKSAKTS